MLILCLSNSAAATTDLHEGNGLYGGQDIFQIPFTLLVLDFLNAQAVPLVLRITKTNATVN